jgi:TRAP-type uncharacterized transport system substrate-binding protein
VALAMAELAITELAEAKVVGAAKAVETSIVVETARVVGTAIVVGTSMAEVSVLTLS